MAKPIRGLDTGIQGQELDARLSGNQGQLKKVLEKEVTFLNKALADIRLKPGERNALKSSLLGVQTEIDSINQSNIDAAKQAASDAKSAAAEAKRKAAEAHRKHVAAMKAALAATTKFLDSLKQGGLDALGRKETKVDVGRQIADAKRALTLARQEGDVGNIRQARRDIQDAQFAKERMVLESAKFRSEGKGVASVTINGDIRLEGVHDVKQLIAELERALKRKGHQSRGRSPGLHPA